MSDQDYSPAPEPGKVWNLTVHPTTTRALVSWLTERGIGLFVMPTADDEQLRQFGMDPLRAIGVRPAEPSPPGSVHGHPHAPLRSVLAGVRGALVGEGHPLADVMRAAIAHLDQLTAPAPVTVMPAPAPGYAVVRKAVDTKSVHADDCQGCEQPGMVHCSVEKLCGDDNGGWPRVPTEPVTVEPEKSWTLDELTCGRTGRVRTAATRRATCAPSTTSRGRSRTPRTWSSRSGPKWPHLAVTARKAEWAVTGMPPIARGCKPSKRASGARSALRPGQPRPNRGCGARATPSRTRAPGWCGTRAATDVGGAEPVCWPADRGRRHRGDAVINPTGYELRCEARSCQQVRHHDNQFRLRDSAVEEGWVLHRKLDRTRAKRNGKDYCPDHAAPPVDTEEADTDG